MPATRRRRLRAVRPAPWPQQVPHPKPVSSPPRTGPVHLTSHHRDCVPCALRPPTHYSENPPPPVTSIASAQPSASLPVANWKCDVPPYTPGVFSPPDWDKENPEFAAWFRKPSPRATPGVCGRKPPGPRRGRDGRGGCTRGRQPTVGEPYPHKAPKIGTNVAPAAQHVVPINVPNICPTTIYRR